MRFRITHFFIVILLFALSLLPLSIPSVWWLLALPAVLSLLAVYSTFKVVQSPTGGRIFWAAFPLGLAAYLAGVALVVCLTSMRQQYASTGVWDDYLGVPLWKLIHGVEVFTWNRRGVLNEGFLSFLVYVHVVLAALTSSLAAFIAQVVATWRTPTASV